MQDPIQILNQMSVCVWLVWLVWHDTNPLAKYIYFNCEIWLFFFLFCYRSFEEKKIYFEIRSTPFKLWNADVVWPFWQKWHWFAPFSINATFKHCLINRLYCMSFVFIDWCEVWHIQKKNMLVILSSMCIVTVDRVSHKKILLDS